MISVNLIGLFKFSFIEETMANEESVMENVMSVGPDETCIRF